MQTLQTEPVHKHLTCDQSVPLTSAFCLCFPPLKVPKAWEVNMALGKNILINETYCFFVSILVNFGHMTSGYPPSWLNDEFVSCTIPQTASSLYAFFSVWKNGSPFLFSSLKCKIRVADLKNLLSYRTPVFPWNIIHWNV